MKKSTRFHKMALKVKKEIGYDAFDIGAVLQTRMANDGFSSSKDELDKLANSARMVELYVLELTCNQGNA